MDRMYSQDFAVEFLKSISFVSFIKLNHEHFKGPFGLKVYNIPLKFNGDSLAQHLTCKGYFGI